MSEDFDLYDSPKPAARPGDNGFAVDQLRAFCERVERLTEEKKAIAEDIKEVKAEAKASGFDMKAFNEMLRLRAMDKAKRDEQEAMRDTYAHALGIFG